MKSTFLKSILITIVLLYSSTTIKAQDVGLSFSFFFPKNGDFSTPISPFSIRGIGFNFTDFLGVQTGASLYRMTGMNVINVPFVSNKPLVGPNFTLLIPAELVIQLSGQTLELNLKGGGFFFYSFGQQLNEGNIDRAILKYRPDLEVVNSNFEFDNKPGFGYQFGAELVVYLNNGYGVSLEGNYYIGGAALNLRGDYIGASPTTIETTTIDLPDSRVDFTGLEVAIGVIMSGGGGGAPKGKKRRRR